MPKVTRVTDRESRWQQSLHDPKAYKVELWDGRKIGQGRTLLSRCSPGQSVAPQKSSAAWDIFVLEGDMTVNGEKLGSGDHVLIEAGEACSWSTDSGCLSLVFVRTDHEWVGVDLPLAAGHK